MLKCPVCSYIIEKGSAEKLLGQKIVCTSCLSEFIVTDEMLHGKALRRHTQSYVTPSESGIKDLANKQTDGVGTYSLQGGNIKHPKDDIFGNIARRTVTQDMGEGAYVKQEKSNQEIKSDNTETNNSFTNNDNNPTIEMNRDSSPVISGQTDTIEPEELVGSGFADSLFSDESSSSKKINLSEFDNNPIDIPDILEDKEQQDKPQTKENEMFNGLDLELPDDLLSDSVAGKDDSNPDNDLGDLEQIIKEDSNEEMLYNQPDIDPDTSDSKSDVSFYGLDIDLSEDADLDSEPPSVSDSKQDNILDLDLDEDDIDKNNNSIEIDMSDDLGPNIPSPPANVPNPDSNASRANTPKPKIRQSSVPKIKNRRTQTNILKFIFMGLILLVFIGVILGQTRYGYFGVKSIFGIKNNSQQSNMQIKMTKTKRNADLIDSFQDFKSNLRVFMVHPETLKKSNTSIQKKVLFLLAGFQVRYPRAYKDNDSFHRLFNQLKNQLHPSGKKWDTFLIEKEIADGKLKTAKTKLDKVTPILGDSAVKHYLYGRLAFEKKNYIDAEKQLQLALLKQKKLTKASYFLGLTYLKEKSYNKAISAFKTVINKEKEHIGAHLGNAWSLLLKGNLTKATSIGNKYTKKARSLKDIDDEYFGNILLAKVYGSSGDRKNEVLRLQRIIYLRPDNLWASLRLAKYLIDNGQVEDAWKILNTAKQKGIKSQELYILLLKTVFAMNKEDAAKEIFKEATKLYPENPDFHIMKGDYYWKKGLAATAAESFSKAIALDQTNPNVYVALGKVLLAQHRYKDAVTTLQQGIKKTSNSVPILEELSRVYLAMGLLQKAKTILQQVLQKETSRISAMKLLGRVLVELNSYPAAITVYNKLKDEGAMDKASSVTYAKALVKSGRYNDAIDILTKWYELDKDDFVVGVELAIVYINKGKLNKAEKMLKHFKEINPQYAPLYSAYGLLYTSHKKYTKAADMYLKATTLSTNDYPDRFRMAKALWMTGGSGNMKLALNQLKIITAAYKTGAVARQKQNAGVYVLMGQIYFKMQIYQPALTNFDNALNLAPERIDILLNAGKSLFKMAHYAEAAQYFRRVLGKYAQEPTANYYLGIISLRSNNTKNAARYLSTTITRAGNVYPDAYRMLGMIYRDQHNDRLAIKQFKMYLKLAKNNAPGRTEVKRLISDYYMKR